MKPDPHIKALADLLVGVVLRELKRANRAGESVPHGSNGKDASESDAQKENAPERGALPYEITT